MTFLEESPQSAQGRGTDIYGIHLDCLFLANSVEKLFFLGA